MDYSPLPNDPDHPADSSPWGSASPRVDKFPASIGDMPPSPLSPQQQSSYGADRETQESSHDGAAGDDHQSTSPDLSERLQSAQLGDPDYVPGHQHGQQQSRSQPPARYQTGVRQQSRQNAPRYKLQAKITALERTGKKDPILRFDVHVCLPPHLRFARISSFFTK